MSRLSAWRQEEAIDSRQVTGEQEETAVTVPRVKVEAGVFQIHESNSFFAFFSPLL